MLLLLIAYFTLQPNRMYWNRDLGRQKVASYTKKSSLTAWFLQEISYNAQFSCGLRFSDLLRTLK